MLWSCACQRGPSQDCWRGGFSSDKFLTCPLARLASSHWVCFFYKFYSKQFGLSKKPWGVRSNLEVYFFFGCFWRFRRRLQSGQRIFSSFPHEMACVPYDILGVSAFVNGSDVLGCTHSFLVVGHLTFRLLVWRRFLRGSWSQGYPWFSGFCEVLRKTALQLWATSHEVASWLLLLSSGDEEGFSGFFLFLWQDF